jgi:hypothetical protein
MQPPEGSDHQAAATTVCPAAKALTGSTQDEAKVYHLDENLVRMPPHMLPLRPGLLAQLCASLLQANREAGHATDRCIHASLRCFLMGGPTCDVPLLRQGLGYNVADCAIVSGPPNAYTVYRPDLLVTVCKTVACIQVNLEAIIEGKPYELLYARVPDPEEGRPKPAFLAASHLEYRCQLDTPKVKALLRESRHMAHGAYSTHTQVEYWKRGRKVILPGHPQPARPVRGRDRRHGHLPPGLLARRAARQQLPPRDRQALRPVSQVLSPAATQPQAVAGHGLSAPCYRRRVVLVVVAVTRRDVNRLCYHCWFVCLCRK